MNIANPFPVIETANLLLRKLAPEDKHDIFRMRKDPIMHEYTDSKPDANIEETEAYIDRMLKGIAENKWIIWAIEHKQSGKVIGTISIWNIDREKEIAELGYGIIPDYRGKGLMKEALSAAVNYGFGAMKLKALDAYTEENNISSNKLLENCRFKIIDKVDDQGYCNDRIYHMIVYRLYNSIQ